MAEYNENNNNDEMSIYAEDTVVEPTEFEDEDTLLDNPADLVRNVKEKQAVVCLSLARGGTGFLQFVRQDTALPNPTSFSVSSV